MPASVPDFLVLGGCRQDHLDRISPEVAVVFGIRFEVEDFEDVAEIA